MKPFRKEHMPHTEKQNNDFKFEIVEKIGVLSTDGKGWRKEINVISFNGKTPLIDIRTWSPENRLGKGVTLNETAFNNLIQIIKNKY